MRIEHTARSAFVAGLVSVVSTEVLFVIGARPGPGMGRAAQGKPDSVHSFDDLELADTALARLPAQDFAADRSVDGKKLGSCHL
jgi:hypothetical protein